MEFKLTEGSPAPDFSLPGSDGQTHRLSDYLGRTVVLYFYPKDNTPACSTEALGFSEAQPSFTRLDATILGISRDSLPSHDRFIRKLDIPFVLLSDEDDAVCGSYDVIRDKTTFGRTYRGIVRSTFLIDPSGIIRRIYRNPRTGPHAGTVLADLQQIIG